MIKLNRKHILDFGFRPSLSEKAFQFAPYIKDCNHFALYPVEDESKNCHAYDFSPRPFLRIMFDIPRKKLNDVFRDDLDDPRTEYDRLLSSAYKNVSIKSPVLAFECGPGECDSLFLIPTLSDFKEAIKYLQKDCGHCGSIKASDIKYSAVGFIYILKAFNQPDFGYKIGKTKTFSSRCDFLKVKLPFDIEVEKNYIVPLKAMSLIETRLHKLFSHRHLNGEWFSLTFDDLNLIEYIFVGTTDFFKAINKVADKMFDVSFINHVTSVETLYRQGFLNLAKKYCDENGGPNRGKLLGNFT